VTKATLGSPEIADALLQCGVSGLGDSRIENIQEIRSFCEKSSISLIRSPMLSQVEQVVAQADISFNTELEIIDSLSLAAKETGRSHGIVLMVELGDLREGIMPGDLEEIVRATLRFPNITLKGIATNLACRSGVSPDISNMSELSALAISVETTFGMNLGIVSGGNSANLDWALGAKDTGRINNLRLGEAIFLGRETLNRQAVEGLYTDAIVLVGEVIESKTKPSQPWGKCGQNAFGESSSSSDRGEIRQLILALGRQDTDPGGLKSPPGITILGASSDHLIVESDSEEFAVGAEITFQVNYSAFAQSMLSPFVEKTLNLGSVS
jgi:predicted amino acid racemase